MVLKKVNGWPALTIDVYNLTNTKLASVDFTPMIRERSESIYQEPEQPVSQLRQTICRLAGVEPKPLTLPDSGRAQTTGNYEYRKITGASGCYVNPNAIFKYRAHEEPSIGSSIQTSPCALVSSNASTVRSSVATARERYQNLGRPPGGQLRPRIPNSPITTIQNTSLDRSFPVRTTLNFTNVKKRFPPFICSADHAEFLADERGWPREGSWPSPEKKREIIEQHGPNLVAMRPFYWQVYIHIIIIIQCSC